MSALAQDKKSHKDTNSSKITEISDEDYNILVLKNRLAKGEITIDEFRALKKVLKQD